MEKYSNSEFFEECNAKLKIHIKALRPSEFVCVNVGVLNNQQRNRHFIAEIIVVLVHLELQFHPFHVSKMQIFFEPILSSVRVRTVRTITSSECVD